MLQSQTLNFLSLVGYTIPIPALPTVGCADALWRIRYLRVDRVRACYTASALNLTVESVATAEQEGCAYALGVVLASD